MFLHPYDLLAAFYRLFLKTLETIDDLAWGSGLKTQVVIYRADVDIFTRLFCFDVFL